MRIQRRNGPIPRISLNGRHVTETLNEFNTPTIDTEPFTLLTCTVQPYVGDDFTLGAEGFGTKEVFTVFTATQLTAGSEASEVKADEVQINGQWFKVIKVQPWGVGVIPHYCATVILKDEGLV
jgi:hypothetical protein